MSKPIDKFMCSRRKHVLAKLTVDSQGLIVTASESRSTGTKGTDRRTTTYRPADVEGLAESAIEISCACGGADSKRYRLQLVPAFVNRRFDRPVLLDHLDEDKHGVSSKRRRRGNKA